MSHGRVSISDSCVLVTGFLLSSHATRFSYIRVDVRGGVFVLRGVVWDREDCERVTCLHIRQQRLCIFLVSGQPGGGQYEGPSGDTACLPDSPAYWS